MISPVPVGWPPVAFAVETLNQRLPFGPEIIPATFWSAEIGSAISDTDPWRVMLATPGVLTSENQMLPSGPAAMASGWLFGESPGNSLIVNDGSVLSSN